MKNNKVCLNLLLVVTISLSGCTRKQTVVQNPQLNSYESVSSSDDSPGEFSKELRTVSRVPGSEYSEALALSVSSRPEIAGLKAWVRENPSDSQARRELADLCRARGAYITALEHYEVLAEQLPNDPEIQLVLANVWRDLKNYPSSLRHVKKAIELDSASIAAYRLLGDLCREKADFINAERAYLVGLQIDPNDAGLLSSIGQTLVELEQVQEAQGFLEGALALNPYITEAREALAVVKALLGDQEGGLEQLMLVHQPAEAYSRLGTIYLEEEQWTRAQSLFQRALELDPNLNSAAWNLSIAESYISPPSVVAIPAFGGTELQLAENQKDVAPGVENTLALNEDLDLPALNSLHDSIVNIPGFGGPTPQVAGLETASASSEASPDLLPDEEAGLWTDEILSLPRDIRPSDEFLVFKPESKVQMLSNSTESLESELKVNSLSKPVPAVLDRAVPLPGLDSEEYIVLSEVYAVVTIPPFRDALFEPVAPPRDEQPALIVESGAGIEVENSALQHLVAAERVQDTSALRLIDLEVAPVDPSAVSWVAVYELRAGDSERVEEFQAEPLTAELTTEGSLNRGPEALPGEQEGTVVASSLSIDQSDEPQLAASRSVALEAFAQLHQASAEGMNLYRTASEPPELSTRKSRLNFSVDFPKAASGFSNEGQETMLPLLDYRSEIEVEDQDISALAPVALDLGSFGDGGGMLDEGVEPRLDTTPIAEFLIPGVTVHDPVMSGEVAGLEANAMNVAEAEVPDTVRISKQADELKEESGLARTEAALVETDKLFSENEMSVVPPAKAAANESALEEGSKTRESRFAGIAWAFLFAGLLSAFLAMAIHLTRRRTAQTTASEV